MRHRPVDRQRLVDCAVSKCSVPECPFRHGKKRYDEVCAHWERRWGVCPVGHTCPYSHPPEVQQHSVVEVRRVQDEEYEASLRADVERERREQYTHNHTEDATTLVVGGVQEGGEKKDGVSRGLEGVEGTAVVVGSTSAPTATEGYSLEAHSSVIVMPAILTERAKAFGLSEKMGVTVKPLEVVEGTQNQYSVGSPSACTPICLEAALQILRGQAPSAHLVDQVVASGGRWVSDDHPFLEEFLTHIPRYQASFECLETSQVPRTGGVRRLLDLVQQRQQQLGGVAVAALLIKPPETVCVILEKKGSSWIVFDSHARPPAHQGAAFVRFRTAFGMCEFLEALFPVLEPEAAELLGLGQLSMMDTIEFTLLSLVPHSRSLPLPPPDFDLLLLRCEAKKLKLEIAQLIRREEVLLAEVRRLQALPPLPDTAAATHVVQQRTPVAVAIPPQRQQAAVKKEARARKEGNNGQNQKGGVQILKPWTWFRGNNQPAEGQALMEEEDEEEEEIDSGTLAWRLQQEEERLAQDFALAKLLGQDVFHCPICLENKSVEDCFLVSPCQHQCCRECATEHVMHALRNNEPIPISCPSVTCPTKLHNGMVQQLLKPKDLEHYIKRERVAGVSSPAFTHCGEPDCDGVAELVSRAEFFECPKCHAKRCLSCRQPFHFGVGCDEVVGSSVSQDDGTAAVRELLKADGNSTFCLIWG